MDHSRDADGMDYFHDVISFISASAALICAAVSMLNNRKISQRMDELIEVTKNEAYARGILAGREEGR